MYPYLPWIALAIFVVSATLWPRPKADRARIRAAWLFLAMWAVAWGSEHTARLLGQNITIFGEFGRAMVELALLNIGTILIFDYALDVLKLPRLVTEIALVAGFLSIIFRMMTRLGSDLTSLVATSAVATAVVGFALQDMLGNVVGGAVLELEGGVKIGDWIRVGDVYGCVQRVRLRHTEVLTGDGDTVYIPNSLLTRNSVTKIKRLRRNFITFLAPYSHLPQDVQRAIELALTDSPLFGVAAEPKPKCIVQDYAQTHVKYSAVVWLTEPGQESSAISGVLVRIYYALSRTGIPVSEIPQIIEISRRQTEDEQGKAMGVLKSTPIFRLLDETDKEELSGRMKMLRFAPGEYLIRQGELGDSMFFLTQGRASVVLQSDGKIAEQVAVLGPGDFLGEACLLTGEPRSASAIAISAVECYTLDKLGLQDLMNRRPEIAEDIAVIITHRSMELMAIRERLDLETAKRRREESQVQLLGRIRRFFGIDNREGVR